MMPIAFFSVVAIVFLVMCISRVIAMMIHRRSCGTGIGLLMVLPVMGMLLAWVWAFVSHGLVGRAGHFFWPRMDVALPGGPPQRGKTLCLRSPFEGKAAEGPQAKAEADETGPTPPRAEAAEPAADPKAPAAKGAEAAAAPPEWIGAPPRRTPEGYQVSVATDPFATFFECQRQLPEVLRRAVAQYVALYLGDEALAGQIELSPEFILREVVKAQWEESYESSVGPMVRLHALLLFDKQLNAQIDEAYHQHLVQRRVWHLGVVLAGMLAVLAAAWAYLRLDLATGGRYRWRLRLAAGAAILGVMAAGWAILA